MAGPAWPLPPRRTTAAAAVAGSREAVARRGLAPESSEATGLWPDPVPVAQGGGEDSVPKVQTNKANFCLLSNLQVTLFQVCD